MNNVNKTLYIPLYGKALVSRSGLFLCDKKAEEIWDREGFVLKGKAKSKWLAYYMGIRSAVFDAWLKRKMTEHGDAVVIHIGCGLDSRVLRVGHGTHRWYDIDFPEVISERRRYYSENDSYSMLSADIRNDRWLDSVLETGDVIVVMEGVSMYLDSRELGKLICEISNHFETVSLLIDCYTPFAAKMSKYKNPINDVGVRTVYGLADPLMLETEDFKFLSEHNMTPDSLVNELEGIEKAVFKKIYAGSFSKKLYRLYEFETLNKEIKNE